MEKEQIRVLIADDHKLICEGLRLVLERDGLEVVGIARTGRQALEMATDLEPDIILLDIIMPGMNGLEVLGAIRSSMPQISVIVLTAYGRPDFMARAIALGAAGYITKDDEPKNIPRAVRAVVGGDAIVNPEILKLAFNELSELTHTDSIGPTMDRPSLTSQQLRVLTLITEGLDNATIAEMLSVSVNTVKTHVRNIFIKLDVSDRTQAAIWAFRNGLVR
jgi:two-component system response regulator DegU